MDIFILKSILFIRNEGIKKSSNNQKLLQKHFYISMLLSFLKCKLYLVVKPLQIRLFVYIIFTLKQLRTGYMILIYLSI